MKKIKFYKGDMIEVEVYDLVDFYDPILREPTVPVKLENLKDFDRARDIAFSLAETLDHYQGLGISANQVGLKDRVCAVNMGEEIWTMFNPEIIERSAVPSKFQEGCLSYPGLYLNIDRAEWVKVKFQAVGGQWVEETFSGLTAVCIQHELDHLDGIIYTDKVSSIKLDQAKRKVKKNLKRMKLASEQYAREQELAKKEMAIKSQKQKAVPIPQKDEPTITILDRSAKETISVETPSSKEIPDKFVYKIVSS